MSLTNLHQSLRLTYQSFYRKIFKNADFSNSNLIKGFFISFFLSLFIFLEHFLVPFSHEIFAFFTFGYLSIQDRKTAFFSGFFVGLLWFYWISFSSIYYGFWFLVPFIILIVSLIYGFLFYLCFYFQKPFLNAFLLLSVSLFFHPFGFNWFDLRLLLVNSNLHLEPHFTYLFYISSVVLFAFKKNKRLLFVPLLLLCINFHDKTKEFLPFEIELTNTNIAQDKKWDPSLKNGFIADNLEQIDFAISNKKRLIIFPESAFPTFLNKQKNLIEILKEKSHQIAIITGSLTLEDKKFYNSTYFFDKGEMKIFHKMILVPFGEEIPMPSFLKDMINYYFYGGAQDFATASNPQDYTIDRIKIRNAICFEATKDELYQNAPKFFIAISNNGWFVPSTEPTLQKLLLKLYAKLYNVTIYHSVNASKSEIIN